MGNEVIKYSGERLEFDFYYNDEETKEIKASNQDITLDFIRRIALWKNSRVVKLKEGVLNDLQKIQNNTDLQITDIEVENILEKLTQSKGIGFPLASTILKFIRPDVFPIIDVRAYRVLFGKKMTYAQYNVDKYLEYAEKIKEISGSKNIDLCKVDEQLYCLDKKLNGKI